MTRTLFILTLLSLYLGVGCMSSDDATMDEWEVFCKIFYMLPESGEEGELGEEMGEEMGEMGTHEDLEALGEPVKALDHPAISIFAPSDDFTKQYIFYHYCSVLSEDLTQCVSFDGDQRDSKIVGVHYIISEASFKTLPEEEKKLWHSHYFEAMKGLVSIYPYPGAEADLEWAKHAFPSYGKAIRFWDVHGGDPLPMGAPTLSMPAINDTQVDFDVLNTMDEILGVSHEEREENRAAAGEYTPLPGADSWATTGKATIFVTEDVDFVKDKPI